MAEKPKTDEKLEAPGADLTGRGWQIVLAMRVLLTLVTVGVTIYWRHIGHDKAADRGAIVALVLIFFWFGVKVRR